MSAFADHFSGQAADYAVFRPRYPADFISHLAEAGPGRELAWDAGTGSGQAATLLAAHFRRVVATDASAEQIRHATPHPGVVYRVGREDACGLPDASVDLVSVAQAAHWFNLERFYREAARVLKPGGLLALWCYSLASVDPAVDAVVQAAYNGRLGAWWPPQRRQVDEGYRGLPFPYPELPPRPWTMECRLSRPDYLGYLGTWSALAAARRATGVDPLPEIARRLAAAWPDPDEIRVVTWRLHLRAGLAPARSTG